MVVPLTPWILASLLALHAIVYPRDPLPPSSALEELASAIDHAAHAQPLSSSATGEGGEDDGVIEMAAELAVLAVVEGHLSVDAIGLDDFGESLGAFQIHETTLRWLAVPRRAAFDPRASAAIAAQLVAKSHAVCRARPREEALGWFASGGRGCSVPEGLAASRRRMALAAWVRQRVPMRWVDST